MKDIYNKVKPYLAVIFLQFGYAGMRIIAKFGLNHGMSHYTFAVYRNVVAAVVFAAFALVLERYNLYYNGMKYATATFSAAMLNVLPALTFVMAWIFRLEKVSLRRKHSQAKVLGTLVTVGGAMIMTLVKGALIDLPWTKMEGYGHDQATSTASATDQQDPIKGALMMGSGCFCWAAFYILQGIICSGVSYYISGVLMKERGPVFVSAFNPLTMVIVAILSTFIFAEQIFIGRLVGAIVIVIGLYLVIWGKTKDHEDLCKLDIDHKAITNGDNTETEASIHGSIKDIGVVPKHEDV
ncbi:hypothetical protein Vadar_031608 [Vaccinium darrowii]|uniref:Uncharacterized protein n=1 Tax=Vaccinium darrowii TaxID=229202 RepID=A0ACB7XLB4_9ERIC|nr:hypothetical protein Vadar_031608 [Vaccinium darrowii]